jgi:hypothetical protein
MREQLAAILDSVLAMPVEVIIGAVFLSLLLALPVAWAHVASRRDSKNHAMFLVASAMTTILVGMAIAAGQAWRTARAQGVATEAPPHKVPGPTPTGDDRLAETLAWIILEKADTNRDGLISSAEAATLGDQFVRAFVGPGKDSIDVATLGEAFRAYGKLAQVTRVIVGGEFEKVCLKRAKAAAGARNANAR